MYRHLVRLVGFLAAAVVAGCNGGTGSTGSTSGTDTTSSSTPSTATPSSGTDPNGGVTINNVNTNTNTSGSSSSSGANSNSGAGSSSTSGAQAGAAAAAGAQGSGGGSTTGQSPPPAPPKLTVRLDGTLTSVASVEIDVVGYTVFPPGAGSSRLPTACTPSGTKSFQDHRTIVLSSGFTDLSTLTFDDGQVLQSPLWILASDVRVRLFNGTMVHHAAWDQSPRCFQGAQDTRGLLVLAITFDSQLTCRSGDARTLTGSAWGILDQQRVQCPTTATATTTASVSTGTVTAGASTTTASTTTSVECSRPPDVNEAQDERILYILHSPVPGSAS